MSNSSDFETTVRTLKDIEEIRNLKAKYFRCVDARLLDELLECFSDDVSADYALPEHLGDRLKFNGKKELSQFFQQRKDESGGSVIRLHHGHNPEIEITSATTAKATWPLFLYRIETRINKGTRILGCYYEEFVKENNEWKIKSIKDVLKCKEVWTVEECSLLEE